MRPTPDADANALLEGLAREVRLLLGDQLVGIYLYGSAVSGAFEPRVSDLDTLAATSADIDPPTFEALRAMHAALAARYPTWDDRIEVQYMSIDALRTFKHTRSTIAVISPGDPLHFTDAGDDWTANWYDVQHNGLTLYGPSPRSFIAPVSRAEFVQAVREEAQRWPGYLRTYPRRRGSLAYAVLTMCRSLYTSATGEQVSKRRAAEWAQSELPEWAGLIRDALEVRHAPRAIRLIDGTPLLEPTLAFVNAVNKRLIEG